MGTKEPQKSVLTTFLIFPNLHSCYYKSIVTNSEKKKAESIAHFDYQTVTSPFALSFHHHLVISVFSKYYNDGGVVLFLSFPAKPKQRLNKLSYSL